MFLTTAENGDHGGRGGHGHSGNETDLTGDAATKVKAAVLAANTGATVERMNTEDDGSAAYEAHITPTRLPDPKMHQASFGCSAAPAYCW